MNDETGYRSLYVAPAGTTGNPDTNIAGDTNTTGEFAEAGGMLAGSDLEPERGQVDTADGLFRPSGAKIAKTVELVDVAGAYQTLKSYEGQRVVVALERVGGGYHIHKGVRVKKVRYTGRVDYQNLRTMKLAYEGVSNSFSSLMGENPAA